ncbi:ankyrin repeat-containing domain protein [Dactylonectria macrodidyma]|uniref:Ankyrin repeat-containing domain protein n=1 Tax=Dactylonectria macrodidyma TaxID=307937 RepID=A0A9P9J462_9HYPO|nr:ankyrin repeat-containing domain protein [Dactylonectria macrodidyma]
MNQLRINQASQKATEHRGQVLNWLTPTDYNSQQHDFFTRRQPGTGQWLLDLQEYKAWLSSTQQTLFCPGIPGAGKTILTSVVVDDLIRTQHADPSIGVGFSYCNYKRQSIQTTVDMFSSLLKQLGQKTTSVFDLLDALHIKCNGRALGLYSKVFIIIDALDEFQETSRRSFLRELGNIQNISWVNFYATSRSISDILDHFSHSSRIEIRARQQDVEAYLEANLDKLPSCVQKNRSLQEEIKSSISEAVDGMFLLAHIYLGSLDDKLTPKKIRTALASLRQRGRASGEHERAQALSQAYDQVMERITNQRPGSKKLALLVLAWITFAKAPLTAIELQHALAIEVGDAELDEDNMPQVEDMVSVCAGLVTLDKESRVVRLVHYTTQEYLRQKRDFWGLDPEAEIATACIAYISLEAFKSDVCSEFRRYRNSLPNALLYSHPFYRYAARNWGSHVRGTSKSCPGMLEFLQSTEHVLASMFRFSGNGLHLASWFGIQEVVDTPWAENLLESSDELGTKPLSWAVENGQEQMVKRLLEKGARYDTWSPKRAQVSRKINMMARRPTGRYYIRPISCAAEAGHEGIVRLLLRAGCDPDDTMPAAAKGHNYSSFQRIFRYDTPLAAASWSGAIRVVEILLKAGADRTVELLLKNGADPDARNGRGNTALTVEVLLKNGADPNIANTSSETALSRASERGSQKVVGLLLASGAT